MESHLVTINTPEKVITYLSEEGVAHDDTADNDHLYMLAKRRLRRRLFESGEVATASKVNPTLAMSVEEFKGACMRMKVKALGDNQKTKMWPTVLFRIDEFTDIDTVCVKHQVAFENECKGRVHDGQCTTCYDYTEGVNVYSFKVMVEDEKKPKTKMPIQFSDKGGVALFKRPATEFGALSRSQQGDEKELVTSIRLAAKLIVTFDPNSEDFFVCAFDVVKVE